MDVNAIKHNQPVKATMQDGTVKDGIVKGITEDTLGNINVTVEYPTQTRKDFALNKVEPV